MLNLDSPLWLALLPLPWLLWFIARRLKIQKQEAPALLHPQAELLSQLHNELSHSARPPWLWLAGFTLLFIALARPQWIEQPQESRNFMLALDVSGSMRALDFSIDGKVVSRLDMVKDVVSQFIQSREGDRIGIIIFADDAFTLSPLTSDHRLIRNFLADVRNGMAGEKTALGQAVALGVKRLKEQAPNSRALILLTDGTNSAGDITPLTALTMAQHENVRLYSIGIGTHGKVMFPRGPREEPDFKEVPLDETLLRTLAKETGGQYYRATNTQELRQIVQDVEQLEEVPTPNNITVQIQELFSFPLLLGISLVIFSIIKGEKEVGP